MHEIGRVLVWCVVQTTMFGLVASAIYLVTRRLGPRIGASVALAALLGSAFLCLVALSPWPQWEFSLLLSPTATGPSGTDNRAIQQADAMPNVTSESHAPGTGQEVGIGSMPSAIEVLIDAFSDTVLARNDLTTRQQNWSTRIVLLFVGGLGLCVAWRAIGLWALRRQVRQSRCLEDRFLAEEIDVLCAELGLRRRPTIRQSSQLTTAATVGSHRPVILLPATWRGWNDEERRVVLAHELAHIARRDYSTWMLAQVCVLTHFYHPLVHWLASRLRLEQELAADALAAHLSGGRQQYVTTLAQLALRTSAPSIVWPAQAFLPTRSMFLRRIEMLRRPYATRELRGATATKALSLATLLTVAIFLCGLRLPGSATTLAQTAIGSVTADGQDRKTVANFDWRAIADGAMMVAVARPSVILASEKMKLMAIQLDQLFAQPPKESPIKVSQVREAWIIVRGRAEPQTVVQTSTPMRTEEIVFQLLRNPSRMTHRDRAYYTDAAGHRAVLVLDVQTIVLGTQEGVRETIERLDADRQPEAWMAAFENARGGEATVFVNASQVAKMNEELPKNPQMQMFAHLLTDVDYAVVEANLVGTTNLSGTVSTFSPDAAQRAAATLQAAFVLGRNLLQMQANTLASNADVPEEAREPMKQVFRMTDSLLGNAKATVDGTIVSVTATADEGGDTAVVMATLFPAIHAAREAARRTQSMNNLRQIGLGVMNFESAYGRFPPPVVLGKDGKTPHSWRIAILPFIEEKALYDRYQFDQPWDSPDNLKLLKDMPSVFRSPNDRVDSQSTSYFALTGEQAVFGVPQPRSRDKGTKISEVRDGLSKTIMLVEAKNEIPWTKPMDIEIRNDQPLPEFGGWHPNGIFLASFADVRVRIFMKDELDQNSLRKRITKDGGEAWD